MARLGGDTSPVVRLRATIADALIVAATEARITRAAPLVVAAFAVREFTDRFPLALGIPAAEWESGAVAAPLLHRTTAGYFVGRRAGVFGLPHIDPGRAAEVGAAWLAFAVSRAAGVALLAALAFAFVAPWRPAAASFVPNRAVPAASPVRRKAARLVSGVASDLASASNRPSSTCILLRPGIERGFTPRDQRPRCRSRKFRAALPAPPLTRSVAIPCWREDFSQHV